MAKAIAFLLLMSSTSAMGQTAVTVAQPEAPAATAALLPSQTFVAPRQIVGPKLSPDGEKMAFRLENAGTKSLAIINLATGKSRRFAEPEKGELSWFRWAGNDRLLIAVSNNVFYENEEVRASSLYYFDLTTEKFSVVGKKPQVYDGADVLFVDPKGEYLIQSLQDSIYEYPSVYRVSLIDATVKKIVKPQSDIWQWSTDQSGIVRMGFSYKPNGINIYYRSDEETRFKLISKLRENDTDEEIEDSLFDIDQIVSGSDEGYVLSNKQTGRFGLYKFNYLTREVGEKILDHPENDITTFTLDNDGKRLRNATFTDSRDRIKWFDANMQAIQSKLEKALPNQEVWFQAPSKDAKRLLVYTTSATDPGSYFLYEPAAKRVDRFGGINDSIDPAKMADTRYVKYTARDGKDIPAYLTLPKGRAAKDLPLIILPHGGPYGVRDTLDYNAEVQFIASRGYAVLQPNYRGSDTYGEAYYKLGEGQIGRAMQDDLDDGMDWLVKQGTVDAKRVCLVGGSYGGYAALWGVIRNPERYRCAASFAGVTDWKKQLRYDKKFFNSRHGREWSNKVRGDKEFNLDLVSPTIQIARLTRPVLLTHGDEDTNVPFSQYKNMVSAAKNAGIALETKVYADEGHGFSKKENEQDWYDRLEAFLNKHNPAS
jgi:dipeptidyl aminopeptidase/acylaminoacyl peptidase